MSKPKPSNPRGGGGSGGSGVVVLNYLDTPLGHLSLTP